MSAAVALAVVIATGCGANYDSALKNAKVDAMEQVTGTWMVSEKSLRDSNYSEQSTEYNGGVIAGYKVIGEQTKGNQTCVTIDAKVDKNKDNRVDSRSAAISPEMRRDLINKQEKSQQINEAVEYLDNKGKAFIFKTSNVEYATRGNTTIVTIVGTINLSPKWYDDVKTLGTTIDQKGKSQSSLESSASGGLVTGVALINPIAGMATALGVGILTPRHKEVRNESMVCFAKEKTSLSEECYIIDKEFNKFLYKNVDIKIVGKDGNSQVFNQMVAVGDVSVYDMMYPGTKRNGLFGMSNSYNKLTMVLYKEEAMRVKFSFNVPTEKLAQVDKFEFNFN